MPRTDPFPAGTSGGLARAMLLGGALAGALDLTFAVVYWSLRGSGPTRVLQGIATGLLGPDAFAYGGRAALLGLLLFWIIIAGATATYAFASRRLPLLARRPVLCGLAFGALVNLFMTWVVVPLSAATLVPRPLGERLIVMLGCAVCVGLPIALAVHRFAPVPGAAPAGIGQATRGWSGY
ncbi:MAG: hypothetical protein R2991_00450 [Thermoanaerobaculia bacterium]